MNSDCPAPADPLSALQTFLQRFVAETRAAAIAVADNDGALIGGYGDVEQQMALAAWSSAPAAARSQAQQALDDAGVRGPVEVAHFHLRAGAVSLAMTGILGPSKREAERALNRIFG